MELKKINEEIISCDKDLLLNPEFKIMRLTILNTLVKKITANRKINDLIEIYRKDGNHLECISNGAFQLNSNLDITKAALKSYILNSEELKGLDENCIEYNNLNDLKKSAKNNSNAHIECAINLYKIIEEIEITQLNKILMISNNLGDIIGTEILSRFNKIFTKTHVGKIIFEKEIKSKNEYLINYRRALEQAEDLYRNNYLNKNIYECIVHMINKVFNYYQDGVPQIDLGDRSVSNKKRYFKI